MTNNKGRPVQERIAALFGRTSHPSEGSGSTSPASIRHSDVAAALGFVSREKGRVAALVLETHYGSTLAHERELAKAWEHHAQVNQRDYQAVVLTRFAGALAIRQFAGGAAYNTTMYAEYAYLLFSRRESLQAKVDEARRFLQGIHDDAVGEFRRVLREHAVEREAERDRKRMDKAA